MRINREFIDALSASSTDQAVEDIVLAVREFAVKYDLDVDAAKELGDMMAEVRHKSMQEAIELATVVLADGLGIRR